MIELAAADVLTIVLTCVIAAVCVAAITLALLRLMRRRSVRAQLMLVASAGVVAMAAGVVAISVEMYISPARPDRPPRRDRGVPHPRARHRVGRRAGDAVVVRPPLGIARRGGARGRHHGGAGWIA
ncbi:hypothetical protein [Microbacterium sp. Se63.02b]|uniref:hypothetical protein n=1 Tax=Microbacterium sp. Se63.02b TaxID=2709304 RepID=UPI001FCED52F|nr:hypothetical protein [Microbacterium sp. Se63.02b]